MAVSYRFFTAQPSGDRPVSLDELQWNSERHTVKVRNFIVRLTLTEYRLLFPLKNGLPTTYAGLARMAYNYAVDEKVRMMMDKHIDRIRGKLRGTGIYIYCVLNYGYMLLPEVSLSEEEGEPSLRRTPVFQEREHR